MSDEERIALLLIDERPAPARGPKNLAQRAGVALEKRVEAAQILPHLGCLTARVRLVEEALRELTQHVRGLAREQAFERWHPLFDPAEADEAAASDSGQFGQASAGLLVSD